jgi:hypothetical protein
MLQPSRFPPLLRAVCGPVTSLVLLVACAQGGIRAPLDAQLNMDVAAEACSDVECPLPAPVCVGSTLRTFTTPGTCVDGTCAAARYIEVPCAGGCSDGACVDPELRARVLVVFDTSGSVAQTLGRGMNSCGQTHRIISDAKCALAGVVSGHPEVQFGLAKFEQSCLTATLCRACTNSAACGCEQCSARCSATAEAGEVVVPIGPGAASSIATWTNFSCSTCDRLASDDPELFAVGNTPLEGALRAARAYLEGPTSPWRIATGRCTPVHVVLMTGGGETCGGEPTLAAMALRDVVVDGVHHDVRTHVLIMGSTLEAEDDAIAVAGGTDAPGPSAAYLAKGEEEIRSSLAEILNQIAGSSCN